MLTKLRYAGLDPAVEQRLRLAAGALAAHGVQAQAGAWDGTRCDIVAADPEDAYGRQVLDIARRRGTPVLELPATQANDSHMSVARITRALHELVSPAVKAPLRPASASAPDHAESGTAGLVRLASDRVLLGADVEARCDHIAIWLLPRSGRVLSATLSEQLHAREKLASGGWTITRLPERQRPSPPGETAGSLDSFLLQAAWAARERLPPFPHRSVALSAWPDLGEAPTLVEPLTVVQALLKGPTMSGEIARRHGLAAADVNACLWAFEAGNLLGEGVVATESRAAPVPDLPATSGSAGLFARLARHFGLLKP